MIQMGFVENLWRSGSASASGSARTFEMGRRFGKLKAQSPSKGETRVPTRLKHFPFGEGRRLADVRAGGIE